MENYKIDIINLNNYLFLVVLRIYGANFINFFNKYKKHMRNTNYCFNLFLFKILLGNFFKIIFYILYINIQINIIIVHIYIILISY